MGYYVRAFCTSTTVPSMSEVLGWVQGHNSNISVDQSLTSIELNDSQWKQIALSYKQGKLPILVECNRDEGKEDCLMKQEVSEFLERLGGAGILFSKSGGVNYLKKKGFL